MVVVACCLGLGSLLLLSDPEASPDSASVPIGLSDGPVWSWTGRSQGHFALTVDQRSMRVRFARPDSAKILD